MADMFVPVRAGADIAFVGGLVNYVLTHEKYFHEYVLNYTNASVILSEDFADTEDLDGVFSGLNREHRGLQPLHLALRGVRSRGQQAVLAARSEETNAGSTKRHAARRTDQAARLPTTPGDRRDASAPALRLPGAQAALRALHAGDGGADRRGARGRLPESLRADHRELRAGQDHGVRLQRGLDAAHGRRPVHPHGVDPAGAARQHGPAGRRDPRAARARVHPGVHRHPDAVRPAARLPAHAVRHHRQPTWTATCRPRRW